MNSRFLIFIFFCFARHLHSSNALQKIINGRDTDITSAPFMLSMRFSNYGHFCGASIISYQWALTAAHCLEAIKNPIKDVTLCSGSSTLDKNCTVHNVVKYFIHEKYNPIITDYDIALMKVTPEFIYNERTKAVALPSDKWSRCDEWGIICGWGVYLKYDFVIEPALSNTMKCAVVPRVGKSQCNRYYTGGLTPRMVCYGFRRGGTDTCQGDSGGPIVNCNNTLIGITSWGNGCGEKFSPGVYTDVKLFRHWIKKKMQQ